MTAIALTPAIARQPTDFLVSGARSLDLKKQHNESGSPIVIRLSVRASPVMPTRIPVWTADVQFMGISPRTKRITRWKRMRNSIVLNDASVPRKPTNSVKGERNQNNEAI